MVRRLSRKTFLSRLLTAVLVVAFTASFTGVGGAAPLGAGSQETSVTPVVAEPVPVEAPEQEQPAGEATVQVPEEPAPEAEVAPVEAPAPETAATEPAPSRTEAPAVASAGVAPAAVNTAASGVNMTFEGYRQISTDWTTGNIDPNPNTKYYYESDWVPIRLVIENKGATTWTGSPVVLLDHFDSAVGWDATRGDANGQDWYFYTTSTAPTSADSRDPQGSRISVEDTFPGGYGSSTYLRVPLPSLSIPAGEYGVVYFQAHLALTHYWNAYNGEDGSQAWPGSSLHCTLEDGGAKTLPIPVPPAPQGHIDGLKFEDAPPLGSYEGEDGLAGWEFTLTAGGQFPFTITTTSGADGTFSFAGLPGGTYSITEAAGPTVPEGDWQTEYTFPISVDLPRAGAQTLQVGNYVLPTIQVGITKTPWPSHVGVGDSITYDVEVVNSGASTLTSLVLTDAMDPSSPRTVTGLSLDPGDTYEYSYTASPPAGGWSADPVENTVSVNATDNFGQQDLASSDADVDVVHPEIEVEKYSVPAGPVVPGTPVQYFFRVYNNGDCDLDIDLVDYLGTLADATGADPQMLWFGSVSLAAGADTIVAGPTFAIAAPTVDTVVAVGDDGDGHGDSAWSTYDIGVYPAVDISVAKTARDHSIGVSESVTYDVVVTNEGPAVITSLVLTDAMDPSSPRTVTGLSLDPGDTYEYSYTAAPPAGGWSADPLENTVTAVGHDDYGQSDTATADEDVDVVHPDIEVEKSANFVGSAPYGSDVYYTFEIGNHGDVDLDVTLSDDIIPGLSEYHVGVVAVDTSVTVNAPVYELLADTFNTVTVEGDDGDGHGDTDTDTYDLEMVPPSIDVAIEKTAQPDHVDTNDSITYDVVVTNVGASTINSLVLTDELDPESPRTVSVSLAPQGQYEYSYTAEAPEAGWESDPVENLVKVTATDVFQQSDTAEAEADVDVIHPDIEVVKYSVPAGPVEPGTPVQYFYDIGNHGDVALTVDVEDHLGGPADEGALLFESTIELPVETTVTVTGANQVINDDTTNTVTATGDDGDGHGDVARDTYDIEVFLPFTVDMGVKKSADHTTADPGETVTYTITYTNYGDAPIDDFTITDDFDERYGSVIDAGGGAVSGGKIVWHVLETLLPGESGTIVYKVKIDEEMPSGETHVDNVVVITADGDENSENDRSTWRVTVAFMPFTPDPEPFLPFTGGDAAIILLGAAAAAFLGGTLKRMRRSAQ